MHCLRTLAFSVLATAVPAIGIPGQESGPSSAPWQIAATPVLRIGAESGTGHVLWQIGDLAFNSQGSLVVANAGGSQVMVYTSVGRLAQANGQSGQGPGAFGRITSVDVGANDSIFVFDSGLQRISVFSPEGEYARSVTVDASPSAAFVGMMRRFANGHWLAREAMPDLQGELGQIRRDSARYTLRDRDGSAIGSLGTVAGVMNAAFKTPGGTGHRSVPFTPILSEAVVGRCAVIVEGDSEAVHAVDLDRATLVPVHTNAQSTVTQNTDVDAWLAASLASAPEQARPAARAVLASIPVPENMPIFRDVILDELGYIWLQHFTPPHGQSGEWWVYDWFGSTHGRYRFPPNTVPRWIGSTQIAVVVKDGMDVESIAIYTIDRGDGGSTPAPGRTCESEG
jgi:hypothetical protein